PRPRAAARARRARRRCSRTRGVSSLVTMHVSEVATARPYAYHTRPRVAVTGPSNSHAPPQAIESAAVDRGPSWAAAPTGRQQAALRGRRVPGHGRRRPQRAQGLPRRSRRGALLPARGADDAARARERAHRRRADRPGGPAAAASRRAALTATAGRLGRAGRRAAPPARRARRIAMVLRALRGAAVRRIP